MNGFIQSLERKIKAGVAGLFPGRCHRWYSTLDNPMEVPVQVRAYELVAVTYVQPSDHVLDVGFGLGYGMEILARSGRKVSGIEVDKKAVTRGKRSLGTKPWLGSLIHYNGQDIPLPDKSVDVTTCVDVLEHVPDYHGLLREMCRVSRKVVFVSTPLQRPENTRPDGRPVNRWHLREWTFDQLHQILKQHGIPDIQWHFINGPWEGPFECTRHIRDNTQALAPALILANSNPADASEGSPV